MQSEQRTKRSKTDKNKRRKFNVKSNCKPKEGKIWRRSNCIIESMQRRINSWKQEYCRRTWRPTKKKQKQINKNWPKRTKQGSCFHSFFLPFSIEPSRFGRRSKQDRALFFEWNNRKKKLFASKKLQRFRLRRMCQDKGKKILFQLVVFSFVFVILILILILILFVFIFFFFFSSAFSSSSSFFTLAVVNREMKRKKNQFPKSPNANNEN